MAIKAPSHREDEEIHGEQQPKPTFGPGSDDPGKTILEKPTFTGHDPGEEALKSQDSQKTPSRDDIRGAEENPSQPSSGEATSKERGLTSGTHGHIGSGFKTGDKFLPPQARVAAALTGLLKSKKGRAGIASGGIIGAGIFVFSISQGPLQLVHLAETLQKNFFSQEDASETRARGLYRYARSGNVGETRLSPWGSRQFKKIQKYYAERGTELKTRGVGGYVSGMTIDLDKHPDYKGLGTQEARAQIIRNNGLDPSRVGQVANRKIGISLRGMTIKEQRAYLKNLHQSEYRNYKLLGSKLLGKVHTAMKFRTVTKYYNIPSWLHPLKRIGAEADKWLANKWAQWRKSRTAKLNNKTPEAKARVASIKRKLKIGGGVVGGVLLGQTAVCVARDVAAEVPNINRDNVEVPAMAAAGDAISLGHQVKSGDDFTIRQVGAVVQGLENDEGKNIWASKPLQATANGGRASPGEDVDPDIKQAFSSDSTEANITTGIDETFPGACTTAGQIIGTVAGVGLLLIPGVGYVTKAIQVSAGIAAIVAIQEFVPKLLADDPLTGTPHQGPKGGGVDAYGARELANTAYRASGGVEMSDTETAYFENKLQGQENQDFASKSFFARMFDTQDYRSLASKAIDSSSTNPARNMANIFGGLMNIGKHAAGLFSSLLPKTFAAAEPYDWGFPRYGLAQGVLDNPKLQDPYANADKVARLMKGSRGEGYRERAKKCFGVDIKKQSGKWGAIAKEDVNPQSSDYIESNCDDTNLDWKRIYLFIFDTRLMASMECYDGDEEACADIGIEDISGSAPSGDSVAVSGSVQEVASQILSNDNISLTCYSSDVLQDVKSAAAGEPGTGGAPIDIQVLQIVAALGEKHELCVTAFESGGGGHSVGSDHYSGHAVDIDTIDGKEAYQTITDYFSEIKAYSDGAVFLQGHCEGAKPAPAGMNRQPGDACNHQHISVP